MESMWSKLRIINAVPPVQMCGQWGNDGIQPNSGREKVTRTCNLVPCSQLEVVMDELHDNSHITAEDISRVRKHQELDREHIRTIKNSSLEKNEKKEVQPTNTI